MSYFEGKDKSYYKMLSKNWKIVIINEMPTTSLLLLVWFIGVIIYNYMSISGMDEVVLTKDTKICSKLKKFLPSVVLSVAS